MVTALLQVFVNHSEVDVGARGDDVFAVSVVEVVAWVVGGRDVTRQAAAVRCSAV